MLIGEIREGRPVREFHGYTDREASKKKVLRDAFAKGDRYFMTGESSPVVPHVADGVTFTLIPSVSVLCM